MQLLGKNQAMGSIARYEALNFRRRYAKQKLIISDDIIHLIVDEMSQTALRDERVYLDACLEKLPHVRLHFVRFPPYGLGIVAVGGVPVPPKS